eukprot:c9096_g1_i2.p1 GENE.c9096_g1_i2~~c9096_g1_i2.p1  ORF type:complete len:153 (-),score=34.04 c9096_g1_i2:90-548(-)
MRVHESRLIPNAILKFPRVTTVDLLFRMLRFYEVSCQQRSLGLEFIEYGGVEQLVAVCATHLNQPTSSLCITALSALRFLVRFQTPAVIIRLRSMSEPLVSLVVDASTKSGAKLSQMLKSVLFLIGLNTEHVEDHVLLEEFYSSSARRSLAE